MMPLILGILAAKSLLIPIALKALAFLSAKGEKNKIFLLDIGLFLLDRIVLNVANKFEQMNRSLASSRPLNNYPLYS